jgi:hypothetical protein
VRRDGSLPAPIVLETVSQVARAMSSEDQRLGAPRSQSEPPDAGPRTGTYRQGHRFSLSQGGGRRRPNRPHPSGVCRHSGFCQPVTIRRSRCRRPFGPLLAGRGVTLWVILTGKAPFRVLARGDASKAARTSVMTYRSHVARDLRSIAKALRVANVVEGTVRRGGLSRKSPPTMWKLMIFTSRLKRLCRTLPSTVLARAKIS